MGDLPVPVSQKDTAPDPEQDIGVTANPQPAPLSFSLPSYRFLLGDNFLVSHFFSW